MAGTAAASVEHEVRIAASAYWRLKQRAAAWVPDGCGELSLLENCEIRMCFCLGLP